VVTPGGATSAYHSAAFPSWFDDGDGDEDDGAENHTHRNQQQQRGMKKGALVGRTRPVSAQFQKEAMLLSYSMRPAGRAYSARVAHNAAFITSAGMKGQDFGEPKVGLALFTLVKTPLDDGPYITKMTPGCDNPNRRRG
jgi:hypothetical protein